MFSGSNTIDHYTPINMSIWFSMAFQAGAINVGGFLACHKTVTHVTGFATYFGAELSQGNLVKAIGFLSVPAFFLLGTMLSAFFIDRRISLGQQPRYYLMFALLSVLMFFVTIAGILGYFGNFGETTSLLKGYLILAILCLSSGVQNACITSASGSVVRTTHLTGLTTDLGIGLMRLFSGNRSKKLQTAEAKANFMRIGIISFFILGSTLAAFCFYHFGFFGFLAPGLISLSLTYMAYTRKNGRKHLEITNPESTVSHG